MTWFNTLAEPPDGVTETQALITTVDRCFVIGFANLGQAEWDTLTQLERILAGSPLAEAVTDSVAAIRSNAFVPSQFATLAAARVSLQGAMHDALLTQLSSLSHMTLPVFISTQRKLASGSFRPPWVAWR